MTHDASAPLFADLLAALDVVVFERLPNSVFLQVTPSPAWFAHVFGAASQGQPITLVEAFPFLEPFLTEAEVRWRADHSAPLRSDLCSVSVPSGEAMLRATAVSVSHRRLLFIEALHGAANPRRILQEARERELERERLALRVEGASESLLALTRAVAELQGALLEPAQRSLVEDIRRLCERMRATLTDGPPSGPRHLR